MPIWDGLDPSELGIFIQLMRSSSISSSPISSLRSSLRLFSLLLLSLSFAMSLTAFAEVSFQCNLYNSDDDLSVDLQGDYLRFEALAEMDPESIFYSNGGVSTQQDCSYSYKIANDGETLGSGAQTNSGKLAFHSSLNSNYYKDGTKSFELSLQNIVANGFLNSYYSNSDLNVEEAADLNMAVYSESAKVGAHQLDFMGSGSTLVIDDSTDGAGSADGAGTIDSADGIDGIDSPKTNDNSESQMGIGSEEVSKTNKETKKVSQVISVEGYDKSALIKTNLQGDVDSIWKADIEADALDYFLGSEIMGVTRNSKDEMGMIGEATGFPAQVLPPGEIDMSYKDLSDEELEKLKLDFQEAQNRFNEEFPSDLNQALWYSLNQKAWVTSGMDDTLTNTNMVASWNYFDMYIGFTVKKKENDK